MSTIEESGLGQLLREARAALGASLQDVAERAGCSAAYVHKLEQDRVRSPSPRVLAGLANALGLKYNRVMALAGYESANDETTAAAPTAVARFSNAHIVQLLEQMKADLAELARAVAEIRSGS